MQALTFSPIGDVNISLDWGCKEFESENGTKKYLRQRVYPKKIYSFKIGGTNYNTFSSFYDQVKGSANQFYFVYDGAMEVCRFAEEINPRLYLENKKCVAWNCDVSLVVEDGKTDYGSNSGTLFHMSSGTKMARNYLTEAVQIGQKDYYYLKSNIPKEKISGTWSGLKKNRDTLLSLFYQYCRTPILYVHNGKRCQILLPDKLEITDLREQKNIVGFKCEMEVDVVKWLT